MISGPPPLIRIGDSKAAIALFTDNLRNKATEEVRVAYLGPDRDLLMTRAFVGVASDKAALPFRDVIGDALHLDAVGLVMAHNHPGGSVSPSEADLCVTRRLVEIARPLGIQLFDHLIFAGDQVTSFRALGLL